MSVSVIIPTYNRFKFLLNCIKSIKEQNYNNIEIIAGGGVNIENIELLYKLGVREFHLSGTLKNNNKHLETNYEIIRNVVKKLKSINNQKLY